VTDEPNTPRKNRKAPPSSQNLKLIAEPQPEEKIDPAKSSRVAFGFRGGEVVQVEDSPVAADPVPFVRDPDFEAECLRELQADDEIDYEIATDKVGNLIPFRRE
jgi:hypothetical protein